MCQYIPAYLIYLIKVGDTAGIKKCGDEIHFLINGNRIAHIKTDTDENIYGVVGVNGAPTKVSIVGRSCLV